MANKDSGKRSKIILVGNASEIKQISGRLKRLKVTVESMLWRDFEMNKIDRHWNAIIFISLSPPFLIVDAIEMARTPTNFSTPLFAVVSDKCSDKEIRKIYGLGATAVFEWPIEAKQLSYLIAEMIGLELTKGRAVKADNALARSVRAHLRVLSNMNTHDINISVIDGIVSLSGNVQSLKQTEDLKELILHIPGVKGINMYMINVLHSGISDKALSKRVTNLIRDTELVDETTVPITVENGFVTIAGSMSGKNELNALIAFITNIKGIRGIKNLTTISKKQTIEDHAIAKKLNKSISAIFPDTKVSIKCFGGIAVLKGSVKDMKTKGKINEFVKDTEYVQKIVDKIYVHTG